MPRILIIDDDTDLLDITSHLLRKNGFEVITSSTSEDAYDKINSFQPQIIVLDVFLSGVDGLATCKKIKESSTSCHIPVLIISGFTRVAGSKIYDYDGDDFLSKPFEIDDLIAKIHNLLSRSGIHA